MADEPQNEQPQAPEVAAQAVEQPVEQPVAADAAAETQAEPAAEDASEPAAESNPFVEQVRARITTANYGVSAAIGITLVERGAVDLLIFEAKDANEALQAASAALATVPDSETHVWRFAGSGPDLETGRYRAVVRINDPA